MCQWIFFCVINIYIVIIFVEEIIIREEQNEDERQAQGKISSSDKCHKVID